MSLFDAPLHFNFHKASESGGYFDMGSILNGTLVKEAPLLAVTLVENHDTQPMQALESPVADWFKPLAYSIILLRAEGYPCIFYPDYYGATYSDYGTDGNLHAIEIKSHRHIIDRLLLARKYFAYGEQYDYLDSQDVIGWTRIGTELHPFGLAVLMSDGPGGVKTMNTGRLNTPYVDLTEQCSEIITTDNNGSAEFRCEGGSVSVWVEVSALEFHQRQAANLS